jgi:hypothetical protein
MGSPAFGSAAAGVGVPSGPVSVAPVPVGVVVGTFGNTVGASMGDGVGVAGAGGFSTVVGPDWLTGTGAKVGAIGPGAFCAAALPSSGWIAGGVGPAVVERSGGMYAGA